MRKIKTWKDNLNDVTRDVIFADEELLDLMMIPEEDREDIIKFINQYYIRDPAPDEILTTEDVRICWGEQEGKSIGKYVLKKNIFFDVYVKNTHLHDVGNDLLISRADKICQRMKELLTDQK